MSTHRPAWWQLFILAALLIAALVWVHTLGLTDQAEMALQVLGLSLFLGAIVAWLGVNTPALLTENEPGGPEWYRLWEIPADSVLNDDPPTEAAGAVLEYPYPAAAREPEPMIAGRVLD